MIHKKNCRASGTTIHIIDFFLLIRIGYLNSAPQTKP